MQLFGRVNSDRNGCLKNEKEQEREGLVKYSHFRGAKWMQFSVCWFCKVKEISKYTLDVIYGGFFVKYVAYALIQTHSICA